MQICEYGCGQEAKYPPSKGKTKWSCKSFWQQCPAKRRENSIQIEKLWEDPNSGLNSDLRGEKLSNKMKEKWEDPNSVYNSILCKEKKSNTMKGKGKLTIKKIQQRYETFSSEEDLRYNSDKPEEKEIQVRCKNHNCPNSKEKDGWFTPTGHQFDGRRRALEEKWGNDGSFFYCSQYCKDTCPLYRLNPSCYINRNTKLPYTQEEYNTWRLKVLERQKEEDSYNFCEICYLTENLHVHHEKPVKTHPLLALDPDNGIVLCKNCHYEIGHKTGTECSTGNLANKILPDCKLGDLKCT